MGDLWSRFRDRLLGSPRFHRLAFRLPGFRTVARRRARALFDLCSGFVYSQVLLASVRLDLLGFLGEQARSADEVANHCNLSTESAVRLLRAAIPLGLVERRSAGRYGLGYLGAPLLADPGLLALIRHNDLFYADLKDPVALLRGESGTSALTEYWAYARSQDAEGLPRASIDEYSELMATTQTAIAETIVQAYDFSGHRRLMDVGGGEGMFCEVAGRTHKQLELRVADLPAVVERARSRLENAGLTGRADVWGGNFLRDALPSGADVITLIRVVHDHGDAEVETLLSNVRQALPSDGTLLIIEQLAETPGAETVGDTYFGFYLLAMGSGRPRSLADISALLVRTGFAAAREIATPLPLQARVLITHPIALPHDESPSN